MYMTDSMVDIFNTHIQCFWEKSSNWTLKTNQVWQWMLTWGNEPRITLKTKSMMLKDILLKSISSSVIFNGPLLSWWLPTVSLNHSDPDKHKINDNRVFKKGGGKTNGKREILWRDPRQNSPFYSYMCRIDKYVGWMYWVKKYDFCPVMSMEISTFSPDIISHLIALSRLFVTWFCMSTVCAA